METLTFSGCSEDQLDDLNVSKLSVASHLVSTGASRATGRDGPPWTFRTTWPSGTQWTLYSGANSTSSAAPLLSISWASSCFKGPFEHLKRFVDIFSWTCAVFLFSNDKSCTRQSGPAPGFFPLPGQCRFGASSEGSVGFPFNWEGLVWNTCRCASTL